MKRLSLVIAMVLFAVGYAAAQQAISGKVTSEDGEPLIGASVLVEGATTGTVTDFDGMFNVTVPAGGEKLIISYTGFTTQEVEIMAGKTNYEIMLAEGVAIDEVVVTAIGIERKKDEDLSSATLVEVDQLQRSGETGVIQGLAGKTSGINITRNTGDPGAGAYIQIRGQNTILGDGSPLIILDGVPISNSSINSGPGFATQGVVQQSRLNDINPNDIESITVLKGASAAAVYGTGAANGVLVITTKRGKTAGRRFTVNAGFSYALDEVNREYEKQDRFGQGSYVTAFDDLETPEYDGLPFDQFGQFSTAAGGRSWGDLIENRSGTDVVDETGERFVGDQTGTTYFPIVEKGDRTVYNDVNRDQIFQVGNTFDVNFGVNYRGDNSNTYFSFSHLDQEGILRGNSDYARTTVRVNQDFNLLDNVNIRINSSYSGSESNRIQTGSNVAGLYLGYLRTAPDFDNTDYSGTYFDADGISRPGHRSYRRYQLGQFPAIYNNPGWTNNVQRNPNEVDRFLIAPEVNWNILPNLKFTARYGLDYYTDERRTVFPVNSGGEFGQGGLFRDEITEKTQNLFLILNGNADVSDNLSLNYTFGYNYFENDYQRLSGSATNFLIQSDQFILENAVAANQDSEQFLSLNRKNGVFGVLNAEIVQNLLVELSGRLERTAALPEDLFFFPSASIGYKLVDDATKGISFAKIRASYGEVGIEPPLYVNLSTFEATSAGSPGWGDVLNGSNYGGTYGRDGLQGNPNLTIERVKELEFGVDLRFLENRLGMNVTYFDRVTEDALLPVETPPSTGFSNAYANTAEISNKGLEVDMSYRILQKQDISWNIFGNLSTYRNVVEKLPEVSRVGLNGFNAPQSALIEGEEFGVIFGGRYARNEDGSIALTENGFPAADPELGVIGNPNPDWRGGLGTELSIKGLNFSVLFETAQGMEMWNGTLGVLNTFGINPETANISVSDQDLVTNRGYVIPAGTSFRGNIEDFGGGPVAVDADWYQANGGGFGEIDEQFMQDGSWTRLREASVSYSLPSNLIDGLGLTSLQIGVTGRNLVFWSPFEGADPDTNLTGASRGRGLHYFTNPGTRSVLFNIKLGF